MAAPKGNKHAVGNKGGGAPSAYKSAYVNQARKACEAGFTDRELAELFGVGETTINAWKLAHQEFAEALKAGKAPADERVERSLYHRAIGYTFDSEKILAIGGAAVRIPIKEHMPPDTTAMIFWLKNRRKDVWRDKHDLEHSGSLVMSHEEALKQLE